MSIISKLTQELTNLIAAGEVVERPASVVKELIENALDANAKNIIIKIIDCGKQLIRVSDDGDGMDKEDLIKAFSSHSTSKIKMQKDLFKIKTLGFRGEALPSIAAVSDLTAQSSMGEEGNLVKLKNGKIVDVQKTQAIKGTTIDVENLFVNTPARLKHLKSDFTEIARINEIVSKLALSHLNISFSLYIDNKLNFFSSGRGDINEVIASLYGLDVAREMNPFEIASNDFEVKGFTSSIGVSKSNRNFITTILNGRPIKMYAVQNAVIDAYKTYLMDNRFPICIVNIIVDPTLVDVNVHPSKNEVRLSKEKQLQELIFTAIEKVLMSFNIAPKIYSPAASREDQIKLDVVSFYNEKARFDNNKNLGEVKEFKVSEDDAINKYDFADSSQQGYDGKKIYIKLTPIGQFGAKYILAYDDTTLYIVDQHAAAERINYEKFQNDFNDEEKWTYSDLLVPLIIQTTSFQSIQLLEYLPIMENIGIKIIPFGINSFKVSSIPTWMKETNVKEYIEETVEQLLTNKGKIRVGDIRSNAIATLSCKAALKANKVLSQDEMQTLLTNLFFCNNPFTCPHGRPIVIVFTMSELDKMFKRTS